jgi:HK97 family phage portal protein
MGFFDFLQKKAAKVDNGRLTDLQNILNARLNSVTHYPDYKSVENATRYCNTDDVYSVVSYIANVAANVPLYPYLKDKDGQLKDLPEDNEFSLLLDTPIYGMSKTESLFAIYVTKLIQGEFILLKERPELGPNKGKVVKLHYLPPQNVNVKVTTDYPRRIIAYQYVEDGTIIFDNIPAEDIIHSKYFNPLFDFSNNSFRGLSPLKVLAKRLTRIDSNNDVSTAQLQNGGVPGIVYEKSNNEKIIELVGKRATNFYNYLQNKMNKGAPYFSAGELGYIELGLKLADLSVAELEKIDFKKLCNVYRVSDRLFNNDATGSEVSDKGARVGLYTNCVLPEVNSLRDALNNLAKTEFKGKNYCVKEDVSEIYELQQNVKDMAAAFAQLPIMIPSQILSAFNLENNGDPLNEKIYVKSGYSLLEDVGMAAPLEDTGDYGKEDTE